MIVWAAAAFALLLAFAATVMLTVRRGEAVALAALQGASSLLVLLLLVLGVWFGETSLFSIALAAVLLSFPGALVMARILTRRLDE